MATIGIIGAGEVGSHIARAAVASGYVRRAHYRTACQITTQGKRNRRGWPVLTPPLCRSAKP